MNTKRTFFFFAAAVMLACAPDGFAMGVCKVNSYWFEKRNLNADCGGDLVEDETGTSASFKQISECVSVPQLLVTGYTYTINFDFASDALTCFHGPTLSIAGTNRETGEREVAGSQKSTCSTEEVSGTFSFVNEGGALENINVSLTPGDWCASIRIRSITERKPATLPATG